VRRLLRGSPRRSGKWPTKAAGYGNRSSINHELSHDHRGRHNQLSAEVSEYARAQRENVPDRNPGRFGLIRATVRTP
jgi:hypothetical protein